MRLRSFKFFYLIGKSNRSEGTLVLSPWSNEINTKKIHEIFLDLLRVRLRAVFELREAHGMRVAFDPHTRGVRVQHVKEHR